MSPDSFAVSREEIPIPTRRRLPHRSSCLRSRVSIVATLLLPIASKTHKGGTMGTLLRKVIVGAVLASSCVVVGASSQDAAATRDALQMFDRRISEYAALHRRAAASLPPLTPSADVKWLMHARANLSFAIIAARPNARQGDVFTTPVATAFRA